MEAEHWTRLGNSYGVLPARQIYNSLLSLQYEILPNASSGVEPSATNDFFLGVHGRRLDPVRNISLNVFYHLHSGIEGKGNVGMIVTVILENSPASNAGLKEYVIPNDPREGTVIWALREKECDSWTYIDERNSFDTFVEKFYKLPSTVKLLNTASPTQIMLSNNQVKTIQMLTSSIQTPNKLDIINVNLQRARNFFHNYSNQNILNTFLSNNEQSNYNNDFFCSNNGYANQSQKS